MRRTGMRKRVYRVALAVVVACTVIFPLAMGLR
jgi:hypothetical protein